MPMKWYGDQVAAKIRSHVAIRIEYAARTLRDRARTALGQARTPPPSAPGEFPHLVTGHLRRNVQMEMNRAALIARVGTNVLYGRYLEFGTWKMLARPWLSRVFREGAPEVRRILESRVPGG